VLYDYYFFFLVWTLFLRYLDLRVATYAVYPFLLCVVYCMYYYILVLV
jgi:hypothetical protein